MNVLTLILMALLFLGQAQASDKRLTKRKYVATYISGEKPVIDGRLTDAAWKSIPRAGDFVQIRPYEGKEPTEQTVFQIGYDDKYLYVAIRAFDSKPETITRRVARRDQGTDADEVGIILDSYFDRRTAFEFSVNAAGVKIDLQWSQNGDVQDDSWDPVWYVATSIDEKGWTAEMKIPFSQLRYGRKEEHVWGLQVFRKLFRKEEISMWQFIPRDAPGMIHLFGELHGLKNLATPRRIELLPYTVGRTERFERIPGNPFATGKLSGLSGGIDGKIGLTSNLTLDFTLNPDFGQVEADPSVVNLTAFETFFQEKRPFFIEGRDILDYRLMLDGSDLAQDLVFYSRRIGRKPRYYPSLDRNEFANVPDNTSILAALKLSGKTSDGLSIGILDAITASEQAEIDRQGQRRFVEVEPLTNYFISRIQKDYRQGATRIGGMFTATNRRITKPHLRFLNRAAYTGGFDFHHEWKDRTYFFSMRTAFSHIRGDREALLLVQTSPAHYFQRPDAPHLTLDSSRTTMSGHGGFAVFGRSGKGHIRFVIGTAWRSPGLELNDVGFIRSVDRKMQFVWVGLRYWQPFSIFRSLNINISQWSGWNFGNERLFWGANLSASGQFKNYWGFGLGMGKEGEALDVTALRGGPALLYPGAFMAWLNLRSDSRKNFRMGVSGFARWQDETEARSFSLNISLSYRPGDALAISLTPFYSYRLSELQYLQTLAVGGGKRYLFGSIEQNTLGVVLRFNYSLTPNLSIQYYGQPFVSAGRYFDFKNITSPRAKAYRNRFQVYRGAEIAYDPDTFLYRVDEDRDGEPDFAFRNPDFNFRQFRSNLVIRWEYTPGSTLFLVWAQERTGFAMTGDFLVNRDLRQLFRVYPQNIFLIKINRWFSL